MKCMFMIKNILKVFSFPILSKIYLIFYWEFQVLSFMIVNKLIKCFNYFTFVIKYIHIYIKTISFFPVKISSLNKYPYIMKLVL